MTPNIVIFSHLIFFGSKFHWYESYFFTGGFDKITGGGEGEGGESKSAEEDPEVIQARIEAEERRQEKHRKKEQEREMMRQGIRDKVTSAG